MFLNLVASLFSSPHSKPRHSIVSLISEEAGFILDASVKSAIESLPPQAASLAQAEALLKALGVESESDIAALSDYFFVEVKQEKVRLCRTYIISYTAHNQPPNKQARQF